LNRSLNVIDRAALRIAKFIRANNPNAGSEAALKYSLSLLINTLSAVAISLAFCAMTGHLYQGLAVIACFLLLRYFSGGVHLSSSLACCLASVFLVVALAHVHFGYRHLGFAMDIVSLAIVLRKAPEGIEKVSRVDRKYYPLLKWISAAIVSANFAVQSPLLSAVFFVQSLTLLKPAYTLVNYVERRLSK